jgi:hypothetical protein
MVCLCAFACLHLCGGADGTRSRFFSRVPRSMDMRVSMSMSVEPGARSRSLYS